MNKPVSFEIAKLLKEKKYLEDCQNEYNASGEFRYDHTTNGYWVKKSCNDALGIYSAPTIAEVVMWLHEKHGIWIFADFGLGWEYFTIPCGYNGNAITKDLHYNGKKFDSPTEAYEAAIEYCLTKLI